MIETGNIGAPAAGANASAGFIDRQEEFITACAWCRRTRGDDGSWGFGPADARGAVTHGICPACLSRMFSELHAYGAGTLATAH